MRVKIAWKPLINIEDTEDFITDQTPREVYEQYTKLHGACVLIQLNGKDYLCRNTEWDKKYKETDTILIQVQPLRAPSAVLGFILKYALSSYIGTMIGAGGLFTVGQAAFIKAALVMAGSALINQLLPEPSLPTPQKIPDPSPTYTLGSNFNQVRVNQPIPVRYGEGWATPDLAMQPYNEYEGGDQVYHALFLFGQGHYNFVKAKIQDTNLTQFPEASIEYLAPGETPTLIPARVYTASGVVSGSLTQLWSTPSISCPEGVTVSSIGLDYLFSNGLGHFDSEGNIDQHEVTLQWRYRLIDDIGNPLGSWTALVTKTIADSTNSPVRGTIRVAIPEGRHEIVAYRAQAEITDDQAYRDTVIWGGLRGYDEDHPDYGDVTLIALKIKVTSDNVQLVDNSSLQQFQVFYERQLPVWNGLTWSILPSRSIVWALFDAYTNERLGQKAIASIPLIEWLALDTTLEANANYFDFSFDQQITLGEALQLIARAGRTKVYQQSGLLRLWRDEPRVLAKQIFTPDNTWDLSLNLQYTKQPTAVQINYREHSTGLPTSLTYAPLDDLTDVQVIDFPGCESGSQAFDEAAYLLQANTRNESGYFTTGLEAATLSYGDLIAIPSNETSVGTWGHLVYAVGSSLFLSNPHELDGSGLLAVPVNNSVVYLDITAGTEANEVVVSGNLPAGLKFGTTETEASIYLLGTVTHPAELGHIVKISPSNDDKVKIDFTITASIWDTPEPPVDGDSDISDGTLVFDLDCSPITVASRPDGSTYLLTIGWRTAPDALRYYVEVNDGGGWVEIYSGRGLNTVHRASVGSLQIRVAASNQALGSYSELTYTVGNPSDSNLGTPTVPTLIRPFTGAALHLKIDFINGAAGYLWEVYNNSDPLVPVLLREVITVDNILAYTSVMGQEDNSGRDLLVTVYAVDAYGNKSSGGGTIEAKNPQMGALQDYTISPFFEQIMIQATPHSALDYKEILVFASPVQGFTPGLGNLVHAGAGTITGIPGFGTGLNTYVRLSSADLWGRDELTFTPEIEATPRDIDAILANSSLTDQMVADILSNASDVVELQPLLPVLQDLLTLSESDLGEFASAADEIRIQLNQHDPYLRTQYSLEAEAEANIEEALSGYLKDEAIVIAQYDTGKILIHEIQEAEARVGSSIGTVHDELLVEVSAREAIAINLTNLTATVGSNKSSIDQQLSAITTDAQTQALAVLVLESEIDANTASFTQEALTRASADEVMASDITDLSVASGTLAANITSEITARIAQGNALASNTYWMGVGLDSDIAAINTVMTTQSDAIEGLSAQYSLSVSAGTAFGGLVITAVEKLDGSGATSNIAFMADSFRFVTTVNGVPQSILASGTVNGSPATGINGSLTVDGSITAKKINVSSLSAISGTFGNIYAGYISNNSDPALRRIGINLNPANSGAYIWAKNDSGEWAFALYKTGDMYFRGHLECTNFTSQTAVIDTLHLKNGSVTDNYEALYTPSTVVPANSRYWFNAIYPISHGGFMTLRASCGYEIAPVSGSSSGTVTMSSYVTFNIHSGTSSDIILVSKSARLDDIKSAFLPSLSFGTNYLEMDFFIAWQSILNISSSNGSTPINLTMTIQHSTTYAIEGENSTSYQYPTMTISERALFIQGNKV